MTSCKRPSWHFYYLTKDKTLLPKQENVKKEEENAIYLDYKTIQPGKDGTDQLIPTVRPDIINRNQRLELECNIFLGYDHPDMSVMFTPVSSGT